MPKQTIEVPFLSAHNRERGIPLSAVTRANGFLFLSGLGPLNLRTGETVQGSIHEQTAASLDAIATLLDGVGSGLEYIVNARIYVTNAGHYDAINAVYSRYFPVDPPSRTFVTVGSWFGGFDIEIEAIAIDPTHVVGS